MKTLFLLSCLAAPLLQAGQFDSARVPESAEWYLHLDLEEIRESKFGKVIISEVTKEHDEAIANIESIFNLNPLEDLHDVTLFGNGKPDHSAVLIKGKMDRGHLEKNITQADDYRVRAYRDVVVHTWMDDSGSKRQYAAFHLDDLLVFSDRMDLLKLTLDTLAKKKPSIAPDENVFAGELVHAYANIQKIELNDDDGSRLLRKVEKVTITLQEEGDQLTTQLLLIPKEERNTLRLMKILDGLIAFGMMSDNDLDQLDLRTQLINDEAKKVTMLITLPVDQALDLLGKLANK